VAGGTYPEGRAEFNFKSDVSQQKSCSPNGPLRLLRWHGNSDASEISRRQHRNRFRLVASPSIVDRIVPTSQCPTMPRRATCGSTVRGHPEDGLFKLSPPGHHYDIRRRRTKNSHRQVTGRHRYLIFESAQEEKLSKSFTELASAKPAVRAPRVTK